MKDFDFPDIGDANNEIDRLTYENATLKDEVDSLKGLLEW